MKWYAKSFSKEVQKYAAIMWGFAIYMAAELITFVFFPEFQNNLLNMIPGFTPLPLGIDIFWQIFLAAYIVMVGVSFALLAYDPYKNAVLRYMIYISKGIPTVTTLVLFLLHARAFAYVYIFFLDAAMLWVAYKLHQSTQKR